MTNIDHRKPSERHQMPFDSYRHASNLATPISSMPTKMHGTLWITPGGARLCR